MVLAHLEVIHPNFIGELNILNPSLFLTIDKNSYNSLSMIISNGNLAATYSEVGGVRLLKLSIYLRILPYALTDILGRCAVEKEKD